ncbi:unnamed protein product [Trichogramma brassicae]|uniref:Uncharacterized protein n=1 Tax=Trichogramma brassicae TaxID=86971 RepID=A0A6H5I5A5_9HYME|nr:unnamed protein product [Trichogramma brassicae]
MYTRVNAEAKENLASRVWLVNRPSLYPRLLLKKHERPRKEASRTYVYVRAKNIIRAQTESRDLFVLLESSRDRRAAATPFFPLPSCHSRGIRHSKSGALRAIILSLYTQIWSTAAAAVTVAAAAVMVASERQRKPPLPPAAYCTHSRAQRVVLLRSDTFRLHQRLAMRTTLPRDLRGARVSLKLHFSSSSPRVMGIKATKRVVENSRRCRRRRHRIRAVPREHMNVRTENAAAARIRRMRRQTCTQRTTHDERDMSVRKMHERETIQGDTSVLSDLEVISARVQRSRHTIAHVSLTELQLLRSWILIDPQVEVIDSLQCITIIAIGLAREKKTRTVMCIELGCHRYTDTYNIAATKFNTYRDRLIGSYGMPSCANTSTI